MLLLFRARWMFLLTALAAFTLLSGCGGGDGDAEHADGEHADADHDEDAHHDDGDHDGEHADEHPEHGPNGGHIVEFDDEKHHAEWIEEDDGEKVIVLMLDSEKKSTMIPADAKMTITTMPEGALEETFALTAADQADGKASRFESSNKSIGTAISIAAEGGKIMLSVELDGKTIQARLIQHKH